MSLRLMEHLVVRGSPAVVPITADQYQRMTSLGILREGAPIELIDGMLLFKDRRDGPTTAMTQGPRHLFAIKRLAQLLERLLPPDRFHVQQQGPVVCADDSVPEPDLCVLKGRAEDYERRLPTAADAALAIEVAHTSLSLDRYDKRDLYGRSAIPVYWIVSLADDSVLVHVQPQSPQAGYGTHGVYHRGQSLELALPDLPTLTLAVDDILPNRYQP
jgi:Uma2 family endonuclease